MNCKKCSRCHIMEGSDVHYYFCNEFNVSLDELDFPVGKSTCEHFINRGAQSIKFMSPRNALNILKSEMAR